MGNYFSYIAHMYHMAIGRPRGYLPTPNNANNLEDNKSASLVFGKMM